MKKLLFIISGIAIVMSVLPSCKKTVEYHNIAKPYVPPTKGITSTTLGVKGSTTPTAYSGTLIANTTYTVVGDIEVALGDTLYIQPGVTVCVQDTSTICVKGVLVSVGTQASPIVFTDCAVTPTNALGTPYGSDPAWTNGTSAGWWSGIQCDTSCTLCLLKWTQIWFTGAVFHRQEPIANTKNGGTSYGIYFQRTNGNFIMEDCKMYGGIDDAVRIETGQLEVMRCVFEKMGSNTGDNVNMKSGAVGDFAYNLVVGCATNGSKASNKGGSPVQCNVCMYNNTYINDGYRQSQAAHGGCIDYEQNAEGAFYNNLIVDCKVGVRVLENPIADTAHLWYSNNFIYGDSSSVTGQFYPNPLYITKLNCYVAPIPAETGYTYNPSGSAAFDATDANALMGANNVNFVGFPLPENYGLPLIDINNYESPNSFNFRLASNSPCINAGTISFQSGYPINACAAVVVPKVGFIPNESAPCSDIGCYPYANVSIGNQQ